MAQTTITPVVKVAINEAMERLFRMAGLPEHFLSFSFADQINAGAADHLTGSASNGGTATYVDNTTSLSSGKLFSVRNAGSELVYVGNGGGIVSLAGSGTTEAVNTVLKGKTGATTNVRLIGGPGSNDGYFALTCNEYFDTTWKQDNTALPGWMLQILPEYDKVSFTRFPANSTTATDMFAVDANGNLTSLGIVTGNSAANSSAAFVFPGSNIYGRIGSWNGSQILTTLNANYTTAWVQDDATKESWYMSFDTAGGGWNILRMPAGGSSWNTRFQIQPSGSAFLYGSFYISSGNSFANMNNNARLIMYDNVPTLLGYNAVSLSAPALQISSGGNNPVGQATLAAGTVTVSTTSVTASSIILLTPVGTGTGVISVGTITAGTSFVINSSSGTDTRKVNYLVIN